MIGLRDSLTLARTKVRSKRIRLLITTIVSGLLFGILAGGVLLFDGTSASIDRFAKQNLGGRYLVQGYPTVPQEQSTYYGPEDPKVVAEVETLHAAYIAERKAAAKKHDVIYDEKTEAEPVVDNPYADPALPKAERKMANTASVAWQRFEAARLKEQTDKAAGTPARWSTDTRAAGATDTYEPRRLQFLNLTYLKDGREDLTATRTDAEQRQQEQEQAEFASAITSSDYTLIDNDLVEAFISEPNAARATPKGVPVLLPVDDAQRTLGAQLDLPTRPKDSGAQVDWYRQVRDKLNGITFTTCYRNEAELDRIEQAKQIAIEVAAAKGKPASEQPPLVLDLPTKPCGMVTVASDDRTERQKERDANQAAFEAEFTSAQEPRAELVTFQVVGVLPTPGNTTGGLESLVSEIVGTSYGYGALIPKDSLAQMPTSLSHRELFEMEPADATMGGIYGGYGPGYGEATFIASFPTVEGAKRFIADSSCSGGGGVFEDYYTECGKPFGVTTYGTSYLVVDDIARETRPFLIGLLAVLFGVATIIIWAMMGRVIADSRRETAVFRAIGAKRSDIIKVYLLYSLWVALRIALFAGLLAGAIVLVIEYLFTQRATNAAQLAYGVFDGDARFHFLGMPGPLFWGILGGILAMALVAITPPLLRNIRRNPIRDMRDE